MAEKRKTTRKSKTILSEAKAYKQSAERELQKLEEAKKLLSEAEKEEKENLEKTDKEIQELCESKGVKIGVLITQENLHEIISTLIKNGGEPIFIKPVVQYDDD